jgi:hypothetical protein
MRQCTNARVRFHDEPWSDPDWTCHVRDAQSLFDRRWSDKVGATEKMMEHRFILYSEVDH